VTALWLSILAASLLCVSCSSDLQGHATVSGKVAYRGMGIEEAAITVFRGKDGGWVEAARAKSGYHGSFAVRLGPGRYRLAARAVLPGPERAGTELLGSVEGIEIPGGGGRVDRVVIEMKPSL